MRVARRTSPTGFIEHDDVGELLDEADEESPADYYRRQATACRFQLDNHPPSDPQVLHRLERSLTAWEQLAAREDLAGHFETGEGDRKLF